VVKRWARGKIYCNPIWNNKLLLYLQCPKNAGKTFKRCRTINNGEPFVTEGTPSRKRVSHVRFSQTLMIRYLWLPSRCTGCEYSRSSLTIIFRHGVREPRTRGISRELWRHGVVESRSEQSAHPQYFLQLFFLYSFLLFTAFFFSLVNDCTQLILNHGVIAPISSHRIMIGRGLLLRRYRWWRSADFDSDVWSEMSTATNNRANLLSTSFSWLRQQTNWVKRCRLFTDAYHRWSKWKVHN
jgi:hypothetical protein